MTRDCAECKHLPGMPDGPCGNCFDYDLWQPVTIGRSERAIELEGFLPFIEGCETFSQKIGSLQMKLETLYPDEAPEIRELFIAVMEKSNGH